MDGISKRILLLTQSRLYSFIKGSTVVIPTDAWRRGGSNYREISNPSLVTIIAPTLTYFLDEKNRSLVSVCNGLQGTKRGNILKTRVPPRLQASVGITTVEPLIKL